MSKKRPSSYPRGWFAKTHGGNGFKSFTKPALEEINRLREACDMPKIDKFGKPVEERKQVVKREEM